MPSNNGQLRVGVAGLGTGKRHVRGFRLHPTTEVVAAADPVPDRRKFARETLGIPSVFESCEEMLDCLDLDICSIATPNATHKPLTLHALSRGCHVLCEKPLGLNATEVREMLEAAKIAERRVMVNMAYRFLDQVEILRTMVARGDLGDRLVAESAWIRDSLPAASWYRCRSMSGGGALLDLGIHRLDLALYVLGSPKPISIEAELRPEPLGSPIQDVESGGTISLDLESGTTLHVNAAWIHPGLAAEQISLRISGEGGDLWQTNTSGSFEHFAAGYDIAVQGAARLPDEVAHRRTAMHHFATAIAADTPHACGTDDALRVAELIDAAYASARLQRRIPLSLDESDGLCILP